MSDGTRRNTSFELPVSVIWVNDAPSISVADSLRILEDENYAVGNIVEVVDPDFYDYLGKSSLHVGLEAMAGGGNFTAKTQDVLSLGVRFDDPDTNFFDEITLAMNVTAEKLFSWATGQHQQSAQVNRVCSPY